MTHENHASDTLMSYSEAVDVLRADPQQAALVRDAYLTTDAAGDAERFYHSGEFAALMEYAGPYVLGGAVVDLGAGRGIASYAFAKAGAARVFAVEPDPDPEVGHKAIERVSGNLPIEIVPAFGESVPLPDATADIVYMRQVLHHACDLDALVAECARLLKPDGLLVASREHVVDDADQLAEFLAGHPIHQLAGTEFAYSLDRYLAAIVRAGLTVRTLLGPLDSAINSAPGFATEAALRDLPYFALRHRYGNALGRVLAIVPGVPRRLGADWLRKQAEMQPGRLYTFVAVKG